MCTLAFGLSTGEILMSIPSIGLAINWLLEGKFKEKGERVKNLKFAPLFLLLIYIVHIVWVLFASDKTTALNDLVLKLPLLCFPIVLGSSKILNKKEWHIIMAAFILGLVVNSFVGYWKYFNLDFTDYRELSIFISHIRLSLLIGVGVLLLLITLLNQNDKRKYWLLLPLVLIAYYVRILESGTGYISLLLAGFIFTWYWAVKLKQKKYFRIFMGASVISILLAAIGIFMAYQSVTFVRDTADKNNLDYYTPNGGTYIHDTKSELLDNGYYLWLYVCPFEVEKAWSERSEMSFKGLDKKGQKLYGTLYRYVTSKGLRKDYQGVMSLSEIDIKNIENGITSSVPRKYGITARVKEIIYEVLTYRENIDPNGHSIIQRMYYLNAGLALFNQNLLLGASKGDELAAYHKLYSDNNSLLKIENQLRAHNQFLSFFVCFGVIGGLLIIIGIVQPFLALKKHLYTLAFLGFGLLSFITDDVLDTQAGVTFFSFFYCFFLFNTTKNYYSKSITS